MVKFKIEFFREKMKEQRLGPVALCRKIGKLGGELTLASYYQYMHGSQPGSTPLFYISLALHCPMEDFLDVPAEIKQNREDNKS